MDEAHQELSDALERAGYSPNIPPPSEAGGREARSEDIRRVLDIGMNEIVRVILPRVSRQEEELRKRLDEMREPLERLLVLIGMLRLFLFSRYERGEW